MVNDCVFTNIMHVDLSLTHITEIKINMRHFVAINATQAVSNL